MEWKWFSRWMGSDWNVKRDCGCSIGKYCSLAFQSDLQICSQNVRKIAERYKLEFMKGFVWESSTWDWRFMKHLIQKSDQTEKFLWIFFVLFSLIFFVKWNFPEMFHILNCSLPFFDWFYFFSFDCFLKIEPLRRL